MLRSGMDWQQRSGGEGRAAEGSGLAAMDRSGKPVSGDQWNGRAARERAGTDWTEAARHGGDRMGMAGMVLLFNYREFAMSAVFEFGNTLNSLLNDVPESAQQVGDELERIRNKFGGELKPRDVVNEQRPKKAKFHKCFEWDDNAAADKYRDQQARLLIQSVKVVYQDSNGEEQSVRAWSSIRNEDRKTVYVPTLDAMTDEQQSREIIQAAVNSLVSWRKRWSDLNTCLNAVGKVDEAIADLQSKV